MCKSRLGVGIIRPAGGAALHDLTSDREAIVLGSCVLQPLTLAGEPLASAHRQLFQGGFSSFFRLPEGVGVGAGQRFHAHDDRAGSRSSRAISCRVQERRAGKAPQGKRRIELYFQKDRLQGREIAIAIGDVDTQHQLGATIALGGRASQVGMMALGEFAIEPQHFRFGFDGSWDGLADCAGRGRCHCWG